MTTDPRWLSVSDAAELKGVESAAIYNHLKLTQEGTARQRLRYRVLGSMIYVSRADVLVLRIEEKPEFNGRGG